MMRRTSSIVALVFALLPSPVTAEARQVTWEDLLPPGVPALEREVEGINAALEAQRPELARRLRTVMYDLMDRETTRGDPTVTTVTVEEQTIIRQAVGDQDFATSLDFWTNVKGVRARLRAAERAVDPALDGKRIRMPGYLLPLEFDGSEVTEFLLVPYIGACIHVPAPPPNQMVFVRSSASVAADGVYAPVWVEGTLRTESGTYSLNLTDGESPVSAGYVMDAIEVTPYRVPRTD